MPVIKVFWATFALSLCYNSQSMKVYHLHSWQVTIKQAEEIQKSLATKLSLKNEMVNPRLIAGVDISHPDSRGIASSAIVVLSYPDFTPIETQTAEGKLTFPYIPGLLSFRESPLILAACEKLSITPDLILVDGQGICHPRGFGLASHLGLLLNTPTIGCAKSLLYGKHEPVDTKAGSCKEITDQRAVIGAVLRTKTGISPIYVSIGHKVDLPTALYWVMACCRDYRIPEPTRLAHRAASNKALSIPLPTGQQPELFN